MDIFSKNGYFKKWIFFSKVDIFSKNGYFWRFRYFFRILNRNLNSQNSDLVFIAWRCWRFEGVLVRTFATRWVIIKYHLIFLIKNLNENLHVYIKASAGLTVWKLFHIGGMSEIYQIKYCEVTTKIIKISPYWQTPGKLIRNFFRNFSFLENTSIFCSEFQFPGHELNRITGKLLQT